MQEQNASVDAALDAAMLASLGIQYNFSDSGFETDPGDGTLLAFLNIDFVQRFNFSVTDDGMIAFLSPEVSTGGYGALFVFDTAGASTFLAESIFYNLKVRNKNKPCLLYVIC